MLAPQLPITDLPLITPKSNRRSGPADRRRLNLESLETRLNLSGLAGISHQQHDAPTLSLVTQSGTYNALKPFTTTTASAVTQGPAPVDFTSQFGDTSISAAATTSVPVTDYSSISNAKIEYQSANPNVGYMTTSGVTVEYKLNVAVAGNYKLSFGVASLNWASFDLAVNGTTSAQYSFNATGGWNSWSGTSQTVYLAAGTSTIRITPNWGSQFNINAIQLTPTNPTPTATSPASTTSNITTVGTSATITADKYSDIYNSKLEYLNGNADIGYVSTSGAYVEYAVNVQTAGTYNISVNTAATTYASYDLLVNGSQAANYQLGSTGGWSNFTPLSNSVYLSAGTNKLRFVSKWGTQYNIGTTFISQGAAITAPAAPAPAAPTPAAPATPAAPVQPATSSGNPVSISSSWMTSFSQLNVTGTSGNDNIYVSQSGDTLTITANGQTSYYSASSYGNLVIKANGGNDTITVDSSVKIDTLLYGGSGSDNLTNKTQGHGTIVAIGGSWDTLAGNGWNTSYWADTSDSVNASSSERSGGHVHQVSGFWGGVSTDLSGQNLSDPAGTGATTRLTSNSLWGTGPTMNDVLQGQVADCFFLAPLQTLAYSAPDRLRELAVDLGDGTYAVQFQRNGTNTYVRVDGDLPSNGYYANGLMYAHPGSSGDLWMPILEKAYAEFRSSSWNYSSLNDGNFNAVLSDFGVAVTGFSGSDANSIFNSIQTGLNNGKGATYGTITSVNSGAPLIGSHTYTITKAWRDGSGTGYVQLRNPWGYDGAGNDGSDDGFVTLSMYQLQSNMVAGSILI